MTFLSNSKVERAFKSTGLELADYEQVVVDPDSKMEQEARFWTIFPFLHLWEFLGRRNLCTRTAREMWVNVFLVSMDLGYASMCLDMFGAIARIFGQPSAMLLAVSAVTRYEYQVVPKGSPEYDDPWGPTHPEGGEGWKIKSLDSQILGCLVRFW